MFDDFVPLAEKAMAHLSETEGSEAKNF